jgi:hypothetical protein
MGHIINAEITVEIEDLGGYTPEQYVDGLERNLNNALGDGMLTGATPELEVDEYCMFVTYNPDSRVDELEAYYADAIANGKIELGDIPAMLARNGLKTVSDFTNEMLAQITRDPGQNLQF